MTIDISTKPPQHLLYLVDEYPWTCDQGRYMTTLSINVVQGKTYSAKSIIDDFSVYNGLKLLKKG